MRKALRPFEWRVRTIRNLLVGLLVVVLTISVWLVHSTENEVIWAETSRVGTDKEVVALAGAQRMVSFFERIETDLRILTDREMVVDFSSGQARQLFEVVVDRYDGMPLVSFVRVDSKGKVSLSVNRERLPVEVGIDASDRDYFLWAKSQAGDSGVFLSSPLVARAGPVEGEKAVVLVVPVFDNGEFDGLVFASIGFDQLIKEYVLSLAVYEGSEVMVVDEDGTVVYGLSGFDVSGRNMSEICCGENPSGEMFSDANVGDMIEEKTGWGELETHIRGGDGEQWIVGFSPVSFGGQKLSLVMLVSRDEALGRIEKYQKYTKYSLIFAGLALVSVGMLSILGMRRAQVVWFKRGFKKAEKLGERARKGIGV